MSELLVSVAILVFALAGLYQLLILSIMSNTASNNLTMAANDAQHVLEAIKNLDYSNISSGNCVSNPELCPSQLRAGESIEWTSADQTRIKLVTVEVTWEEQNEQKTFQLSTRIAQ